MGCYPVSTGITFHGTHSYFSLDNILMLINGLGTCNIVRGPLKYAGAVLRRRPTVCPEQSEADTVLGPGISWTHPRWTSTDLNPDWTVYARKVEKVYYSAAGKDPKQPMALAIGDSKMCQKWKSAWIHRSRAESYIDTSPAIPANGIPLQKTHNVTEERLRPLEQLATYCRFGETRYGFILTQEELVAFRVRRLNPALIPGVQSYDKPFAGIEYKSVPWDASGPGNLTVNLAIWALGCMGMNDHHRIMESSRGEPLDSMVRLTKWTHDEKNKVYRNDISGREIAEESWKKLGSAVGFVRLDDNKGGASFTSTFTTGGGVASITQGMGAVNLNTTSSRGRKPAQDAAQQPKSADQSAASSSKPKPAGQGAAPSPKPKPAVQASASSSKPTPGTASPPKKYTIAGKKGAPAYEMGVSNGKRVLKMNKTQVPVEVDSDKKKYYYVDPKTKNKVYLAQV